MPVPGLKTRKPTGAVPYPCILLEGEEKAGKTWAAALLSASDKVGTTYWLDLGEGAADEYAAIPGTRYEVIEHDGSYAAIAEAVRLVKAEAARAQAAGEKPVVLVVDTGSALWESLREWVDTRARKTRANRAKLAEDPDAEIKAPNNLWNDAKSRWSRVMNPLLTFPGIVVVTSQGRETIKIGKDGRPIEGEKTWRAAVQESFPYAVNVWLRMFRDANPVVVGARSVHLGIRPGKDAEREIKDPAAQDRLLEWLIFDALKCDPHKVTIRDMQELSMGELTEEERVDQEAEEAKEAQAGRQPAQVGQVTAAAQQAAQRPRRGAERPAERPAGKTAEQWVADIQAADSRDRLNELHAAATAAGQLTQGLLAKMQERVAELAKPAPAEQPAEPAEAPAEQPAAVPQEEDGITEGERRDMLIDEIKMIAELVGKSPAQLTARHLPDGPRAVPVAKLQEVVAGMRGLAIIKLKQTGRTAEAAAYEKVKPTDCDSPANLLTDPEAPQADGAEVDQAA